MAQRTISSILAGKSQMRRSFTPLAKPTVTLNEDTQVFTIEIPMASPGIWIKTKSDDEGEVRTQMGIYGLTYGTTTKNDEGKYEPTTHWTGGSAFAGFGVKVDNIQIGQMDDQQAEWFLNHEGVGEAFAEALEASAEDVDGEVAHKVLLPKFVAIEFINEFITQSKLTRREGRASHASCVARPSLSFLWFFSM